MSKNIYDQMLHFFHVNGLISDTQYGFRPAYSIISCCLNLLNFVYTEADKGNHVAAFFLDFSKAFDIISHKLLVL